MLHRIPRLAALALATSLVVAAAAPAAHAGRTKKAQKFIDDNLETARDIESRYGIPVSVFFGVIASEVGLENINNSWWHVGRTNNYFNLAARGSVADGKAKGRMCNAQICFQNFASLAESADSFARTVCAASVYPAATTYARSFAEDPSTIDIATWVGKVGPTYEPSRKDWAATVNAVIRDLDLKKLDGEQTALCPPSAAPPTTTASSGGDDAPASSAPAAPAAADDSDKSNNGDAGRGNDSGGDSSGGSAGDSASDSNDRSAGVDD